MKSWKPLIVPLLFVLAGVLLLAKVVSGYFLSEEPLNYSILGLGFVFLALAVVSYAAGRKYVREAGSPRG